jgi:PBSX family phage portal protein
MPEDKVPILKARVLGSDSVPVPQAELDDPNAIGYSTGDSLIEPRYPFENLISICENSSSLPQNIQAYVVNIDGLGSRLISRFDLNSPEATSAVRDAMWVQRLREAELRGSQLIKSDRTSVFKQELSSGIMADAALMPTDEEVAKMIEVLKTRSRLEQARLKSFFEVVNPNGSFESLRRDTRQDLETTGNAFWEVLRDRTGKIARFILVPPSNMRCTALDEDPTMTLDKFRVGLGWEQAVQPKFFRRYAQQVVAKTIWFKEFGDPRVVSRNTGKIYPTMEEYTKATGRTQDMPATEIVHFKIHRTGGDPYGAPRWVGNTLSALGSRAADEVNYNYFDNKSVPPMMLLVSGGRISADSVSTIQNYIRDNLHGRDNFHKILVIEAENADDVFGQREIPRIAVEKLMDAQSGDALYQNYDERNIDKVGSAFRLPRLLRGDVRDFNKSTADASMRFADEQIFEPERLVFDAWLNQTICPEFDILLWTFRSLGPRTRDPERVATIIVDLAKAGTLTPNEARSLSSEILDKDLPSIDAPWANQPMLLTLAGYRPFDTTAQSQSPSLASDEETKGVNEALNEINNLARQHGSDHLEDPDKGTEGIDL